MKIYFNHNQLNLNLQKKNKKINYQKVQKIQLNYG